jgi:hypothetical protein
MQPYSTPSGPTATAAAASNTQPVAELPRCVVQVLATHQRPSYVLPWLCEEQELSESSGVVVNAKQGYVLTTAAAVEFAEVWHVGMRVLVCTST